MTKISLTFSLAKDSTYKIARFETVEQKVAYVEAESKNPFVRDKYRTYAGALNKDDRLAAAREVDAARYEFYKKWSKDNPPPKKKVVYSVPTDVA